MTRRALVLRETVLSVAINAVLSFLFFLAVFGFGAPAGAAALGRDCLPQAFMVSLMGSLVPGLVMRRHGGAGVGTVVRRAALFGAAGLAVAGGAAFLVGRALDPATLAPARAAALKVLFGAALAAVVTPIAVRATLRSRQEA